MVQKKEKDLKDIEKETAKKEEAKQSKKRSSSKKSSADKKLNELKEKNDELNDKFLRLYSECSCHPEKSPIIDIALAFGAHSRNTQPDSVLCSP